MNSAKLEIAVGNATMRLEGPPDFIERCLKSPEVLDKFAHPIDAEKNSIMAGKAGLEHSWQWFSLHAGQRMQGVNFFLVGVTFLSAAFVTAMQHHDRRMGMAIGLFGIIMTACFSRLESRVRELIHAGEAAMKPLQAKLATDSGVPQLKISEAVEHPSKYLTRYSEVIRILHLTVAAWFLLGAVYAFVNL